LCGGKSESNCKLILIELVIEKNERTEISRYVPRDEEKIQHVSISQSVTLSECLSETIRHRMKTTPSGIEMFWCKYDLETNNCQQFVFSIMEANRWDSSSLQMFNQGAENLKSYMIQHIQKTKSTPLAKIVSSLLLQYVSSVTKEYMTNRFSNSAKPSSAYVTSDCVHFISSESPEEGYRMLQERYLN
jgi:hypothetical protein